VSPNSCMGMLSLDDDDDDDDDDARIMQGGAKATN
jgi:hypothetical protein